MKLIILDRDGVINHDSPDYIKTPDEWHPIEGSLEAIARFHQAGWKVVVASNQSGLARNLFDAPTLTKIHNKMRDSLVSLGGSIDAFFICPHGPDDHCNCRKPKPGLFHDIAQRFDINLQGVPAVGDSLRDLQASHASGCQPWLVETGNGIKTRKQGGLPEHVKFAHNLADVADQLLTPQS